MDFETILFLLFALNQVITNNCESQSFHVHWYKRSEVSKKRSKLIQNGQWEPDNTHTKIKNRLKGQPQYKVQPRLDNISYNTVYFGFSKIKSTGALTPNVLNKLRNQKLFTGKVKQG